jgi:hypothetical protein
VAFTILDKAEAPFPAQAGLFQTDIDILVAGQNGVGVLTGCAVTAQGSPNMTVAVAAGTVQVGGVAVAVAGGNVTITNAHATLDRFDLIVVSNAGVKSAVAGTPVAYVEGTSTPLVPDIPANSVALATVFVPAADTDIDANQITDKRVMISSSGSFSGLVPTPTVNGLEAAVLVAPPTTDEDVIGLLLKMPDSTWGVGQDYGEGNYIVALSDADSGIQTTTPPILKTISATTDATPIVVTTSTAHGLSTGDLVCIRNTSVGVLNGKWWKITVLNTTQFSLNGSTAPGSTTSVGQVFTDRSPVLFRLADSGLGIMGMHVATGLRGRAGSVEGAYGIWIDAANDSVGLVLHNASTGEVSVAPTADFIQAYDVFGGGTKVFYVEKDGKITSAKDVQAQTGTVKQTYIGDVYGVAGVGLGNLGDTYLYRSDPGVVGFISSAELIETAAPATPIANRVRIYAKADGKVYAKNDAGTEYDLTTGGGGGVAVPDLVSELATDFACEEPMAVLVQQGSFTATTTTPRIDVEIQGSTTGIMHAPFIMLVGPGIAFPLHQGTVAGAKAGVEEFSLGAISGEYVRNSLTASVFPTGVSIGQTVRWEIYTAISGYANEVAGFINGNLAPRITPDGTKLYVLNTTRVTPVAVGRSMENVWDTAVAGEFLPAVPHVFTTAFDMAFKPDGSRGYVADWFGSAVIVVDVLTDRVLTSIPGNTVSVACTADGSKVFVAAGSGAGNIRIIDTATHAVTTQSTAATDASASWVRFSPDGTKLAVYMGGGGGTSNRVYVYTTGTGGTTWTLTATCVIGGATHQATSLAWEGNDIVWVPLSAHNAVYRCVVSTQTVTSFTHVGASGVRVSSGGLGQTLFVASTSSTTNCLAYYVLPSTAGVTPTKYDGWNSYPFYDVELSHDNFIYEGSSGTVLMLHQGGVVNIQAGALAGFWNDYCRVKVFGGS